LNSDIVVCGARWPVNIGSYSLVDLEPAVRIFRCECTVFRFWYVVPKDRRPKKSTASKRQCRCCARFVNLRNF